MSTLSTTLNKTGGKRMIAEWKHTRIDEIAELGSGGTPSRTEMDRYYSDGTIWWVKTGDLNNEIITATEEKITENALKESSCRVYPVGTVLVAMYGGFKQIGRTGLLGIPAAVNQALTAIRVDANKVCAEYLQHWLNCHVDIWKKLAGSSRKDPNITKAEVEAFPVAFPQLAEQKAIASVITAWDRTICQTSNLIVAKRRLKQGLLQLFLTGKKRFSGFSNPLRKLRLQDVTEECSERNRLGLGAESVMAVTKAEGIVPMRERLIGAEVKRYKQVRKGWFAYNPMRINIGSIARSHHNDTILVSPDYVVFRCCEETADRPGIDPDYLDHLRESDVWSSFVMSSGNGSVRVRIYYEDLGAMPLQLPSIAEQRKIAILLNAIDSEISLLTEQLAALKTQKKGLMRKLFSGEVRVKVPS